MDETKSRDYSTKLDWTMHTLPWSSKLSKTKKDQGIENITSLPKSNSIQSNTTKYYFITKFVWNFSNLNQKLVNYGPMDHLFLLKVCWNTVTFIHLQIVYDCFCNFIKADLSISPETLWLGKPRFLQSDHLQKKFANPCFSINRPLKGL